MNQALFIGNLVRDPETSTTQSGNQRTIFTLAVNRAHTDADGNRQADFIRCTSYGKTAELVSKYLRKGRKAAVEASVRTGSYEKDGRTVYTTDFIVNRVEFISSQGSSNDAHEYSQQQDDDYDEQPLPF